MDYIDQARLEEAHGQGDLDATAAEDFIALATIEARLEEARGQEDFQAPAEATNGASEPMPATTQVTRPVEDEVRDVMEEMLLALELIEEEEQEAVTAVPADPAASVSSTLNNSAKKAVRWDDQIAFVKEYEVTVEERRYKRSLLNFINSNKI